MMKQERYILGIDQSTSATKAVLFDQTAAIIETESLEHRQIYPEPGWVEHDPEEIYSNTIEVIRAIVNKADISSSQINHLSITNQRETVLVWDRRTGIPVCNAIVWQCNRGHKICEDLKEAGHEPVFREKTGLLIDPYFSASGISWIFQNYPSVREKAVKGEIVAGTIDSWLVYKLTGGKNIHTDFTNACRTLLLNIHTMRWDEELCRLFNIPVEILPEILPSDAVFGYTSAEGIFTTKIPICGIAGDSHAAFFGQHCYAPGMAKVTYGTGSSVMLNTGEKPLKAPAGLVTSVGYKLKNIEAFVFEGNIHSTGGTVKWIKDSLGLISDSAESEVLASSIESNGGVYFVPAFSGLGAPYWDNEVRANISGITGGTKKEHIVRAALEAIAYQVKDVIELMSEESGIGLKETRADGGPISNNWLMQFQSDMLNSPVVLNPIQEVSAKGAVFIGGLGMEIWSDISELQSLTNYSNRLNPSMGIEEMQQLYSGWKKAVNLARYDHYNPNKTK